MRTPTTVLALLLASCSAGDSGLDRTVLTGSLIIPPVAVNDGRGNDDVAVAQALGADDATGLTWRSVIVSGTISGWPEGLTEPDGDPDSYAFTPVVDGTYTFALTFATETLPVDTGATTDTADTADTGAPAVTTLDADVIDLQLVDPATYDAETGAGVLWEGSSDGTGGVFSATYDVTGGTTYVLRVLPKVSDATRETLDYTLVFSGSAPDDSTILVGAYLGEDPTVAENPVGGTNAVDWTYDAATYTWSGTFKMMWFRQVTATEDTDTEDLFEPSPTVKEGLDKVFVRAGSLSSLNAGPAAGALYTSVSQEVALSGATVELDGPLVLDGVAPKIIGQQVTETLPDTTLAEIDLADYTLITDTLVAQELGMLTGLGYVDIVTGSSLMDAAASGWNGANDSDAFAFTVPESMNVRMNASWADAAADIDFGIWYADPDYGVIDLFSSFGDTYCLTGSNPEVCESVVTLEPEVTYYLVALGYLGTDDEPYTVELEWLAP